MNKLPDDLTTTRLMKVGTIIDHLVDALGSDPSCHMRRALILVDLDEYPGTTQAEIMDRLGIHKSVMNRDIEWLYDYGCIMRQQSAKDARSVQLHICGYSKKNLDFTLDYFGFSHKSLKNFLIGFIKLFGEHKPTLREAKIIATVGDKKALTRSDILENLYNGPLTTDQRAIANLIDMGMIEKHDEQSAA